MDSPAEQQMHAEVATASRCRHGSRLALSLEDLAIPTLLAERILDEDLHASSAAMHGDMYAGHADMDLMTARVDQEHGSHAFDGVLASSSMLNCTSSLSQRLQSKLTDQSRSAAGMMQTAQSHPAMSHQSETDPSSRHSSLSQLHSSKPESPHSSHDAAISRYKAEMGFATDHMSDVPSSTSHTQCSPACDSPDMSRSTNNNTGSATLVPASSAPGSQQPDCLQSMAGRHSNSRTHRHLSLQQLRMPPVQTGSSMQIGRGYTQGLSASLSPHALQVPALPWNYISLTEVACIASLTLREHASQLPSWAGPFQPTQSPRHS